MALPTFATYSQMVRRREHEARLRQQWENHSKYYHDQIARTAKQVHWSSRQSYEQSMSAYHRRRVEEEKRQRLEARRGRLRALLQEERDTLEAELKQIPKRSTLTQELVEQTESLRSAKEERRKKLAQELLREHWKTNNPELRKVESELHKEHVVGQWQVQQEEKKQCEEKAQEEKKRFENEYERARREAMERIKAAEEKRKEEDRRRAEELREQMEELKLREEEAKRLKKEEESLLAQTWEVERLEEERRRAEEERRKANLGRFLTRQYRMQLKRKAQEVQEELESDRRIMAALVAAEQQDRSLESARRQRAVADAAWMKQILEEQLQLERQREEEFELLYSEEAKRMWEKREAEWDREKRAREKLMKEVLAERQEQLEVKMLENREAQEEVVRRREELMEQLEEERLSRQQEKEEKAGHRTTRMQEINAQVEERRREQWEEERRREQEEAEALEALRLEEEQLHLETARLAQQGYQDRIRGRPRTAWT
ncbi:trichoplein keratin filament-binding protein [Engraulis encrasicolus]|uniref:trichoplein keratin filament-binding protein n=1 Tax=Engraulis encrasicolus TaxID=184585 RepID=UPI002FD1F961